MSHIITLNKIQLIIIFAWFARKNKSNQIKNKIKSVLPMKKLITPYQLNMADKFFQYFFL